MKKTFLIALMLMLGLYGFSQEKNMQEKTIDLIKMTSGQQFEVMTEPVVKMIPEANQEAFKKELLTSMDELYAQIAEVYIENFTEEEIDKILAFYNTPVGEKMVGITPELTKKGMEIGQQWGMKLQPMIAKYSK
ncbi:DUF2059 domain-containing protein [Autumnicola musiva]|uniref:DUF2059 domain-containing protein n=1 Tax=Autumnicola musiva TaxID=3075589 RepID=A0ABU3D795_9FLAO|nr:DUF2059 domain-containing protein [Zunongwangia sp. F117]MDT0677412.1 DUF2059 domain-containing protein [Zunongwangia sp. F117]